MKYEQKIIEDAIRKMAEQTEPQMVSMPDSGEDKSVEAPPLGTPKTEASPDNWPKPFSYRELTKAAREIMFLSTTNIETLQNEQGIKNFPKIATTKFVQFSFGAQCLMGMFKVSFVDEKFCDSYIYVSWNGNKLNIA
jgi:hypothetical protein